MEEKGAKKGRGPPGRIKGGVISHYCRPLAKTWQILHRTSDTKQESGKGQGKSWQGVWRGRKEIIMAEGWKGVGQE